MGTDRTVNVVSGRKGFIAIPVEQRFWARVDKEGPVPEHRPELGQCWLWTGRLRGDPLYGALDVDGRDKLAHRLAYELLVGPIPEGLVIDHLCRRPACVNPAHLEPVTQRENTVRGVGPSAENARKTHCKHGHELTPENTIPDPRKPNGRGSCRTCMKRIWLEAHARRRQRGEKRRRDLTEVQVAMLARLREEPDIWVSQRDGPFDDLTPSPLRIAKGLRGLAVRGLLERRWHRDRWEYRASGADLLSDAQPQVEVQT